MKVGLNFGWVMATKGLGIIPPTEDVGFNVAST
jgi:hypothetical protein